MHPSVLGAQPGDVVVSAAGRFSLLEAAAAADAAPIFESLRDVLLRALQYTVYKAWGDYDATLKRQWQEDIRASKRAYGSVPVLKDLASPDDVDPYDEEDDVDEVKAARSHAEELAAGLLTAVLYRPEADQKWLQQAIASEGGIEPSAYGTTRSRGAAKGIPAAGALPSTTDGKTKPSHGRTSDFIEAVSSHPAMRSLHLQRLGVFHIAALYRSRESMDALRHLVNTFDRQGACKVAAQRCLPYHPPIWLCGDGPSSLSLLGARAPVNHLLSPDGSTTVEWAARHGNMHLLAAAVPLAASGWERLDRMQPADDGSLPAVVAARDTEALTLMIESMAYDIGVSPPLYMEPNAPVQALWALVLRDEPTYAAARAMQWLLANKLSANTDRMPLEFASRPEVQRSCIRRVIWALRRKGSPSVFARFSPPDIGALQGDHNDPNLDAMASIDPAAWTGSRDGPGSQPDDDPDAMTVQAVLNRWLGSRWTITKAKFTVADASPEAKQSYEFEGFRQQRSSQLKSIARIKAEWLLHGGWQHALEQSYGDAFVGAEIRIPSGASNQIAELPAAREGQSNLPVPTEREALRPGLGRRPQPEVAAQSRATKRSKSAAPVKPALCHVHPTPLHIASLHGSFLTVFCLLSAYAVVGKGKRPAMVRDAETAIHSIWAIFVGCRKAAVVSKEASKEDDFSGSTGRPLANSGPGTREGARARDSPEPLLHNVHAAAQVLMRPIDLVPDRAPAVRILLARCEEMGVVAACTSMRREAKRLAILTLAVGLSHPSQYIATVKARVLAESGRDLSASRALRAVSATPMLSDVAAATPQGAAMECL